MEGCTYGVARGLIYASEGMVFSVGAEKVESLSAA